MENIKNVIEVEGAATKKPHRLLDNPKGNKRCIIYIKSNQNEYASCVFIAVGLQAEKAIENIEEGDKLKLFCEKKPRYYEVTKILINSERV